VPKLRSEVIERKKKKIREVVPLRKTHITPQPLMLHCWKFIYKWFRALWTTLLRLPEMVYFDQSV